VVGGSVYPSVIVPLVLIAELLPLPLGLLGALLQAATSADSNVATARGMMTLMPFGRARRLISHLLH
jgi:hypothetical protein